MSGSWYDLVLLQNDERLWLRPCPAAGTPVHTCSREDPSFQSLCNFPRWDVTCQGAGPDHVAHDQAMKDASGEGISGSQKADRQMVASVRIYMTSSVHRLQLIHEVFALETSLAFSELQMFVSAQQTLAEAEAGRKQDLFYHFIDRKLEHIQIEGAILEPKYKHLLPL